MSFNLTLDPQSPTPLMTQIYQQVRGQILSGEHEAGERLPASRTLAKRHGVARMTVVAAYKQLAAEGFVTMRQGAGTFVAATLATTEEARERPFLPSFTPWGQRLPDLPPTVRQQGRIEIDFGFGRSFPHIFPYDIWRRLLARYLSTDDVMLSRYGSVAGFDPLREVIAQRLARLRGVRCSPEQVVIVSGAQQALDILARLLLQPDDEVLLETPGFDGAFRLLRLHGARLNPLPVDDEGFPVEAIPADSQARMVFVTPSNQFPHGGTMPLSRRFALLAWAQQQGALIVEDDYDGELRYNGRPLAALQGLDQQGHVVYLGTFSKVLFPALRLGYVVLPPALTQPFIRAKEIVARGAPTLTQAAVADFVAGGHFDRHLRQLRQTYGQRRSLLVAAIRQHLPAAVRFCDVAAGLHVMLYLPEGVGETAVVEQAAALGVGVYAGANYHAVQPAPSSILLGFSGVSEEEIEEGVERLGVAVRKARSSTSAKS